VVLGGISLSEKRIFAAASEATVDGARPVSKGISAAKTIAVLTTLGLDYRAWRYRIKVEPAEISLVRRILRPGDVAIDVGAHKGAFTYWMRRAVSHSGRVIVVEPQAVLAARLSRVARVRGWDNVTIESCALSSQSGETVLWVDVGDAPTPGATLESGLQKGKVAVPVRLRTLDELVPLNGAVRLVKCDVEGHELSVFRGGVRLLREARPVLLFECEARHRADSRIEEVFEHLEAIGYIGWFCWGDRLRPRGELSIEHQDPTSRSYVNNFVFSHPEVWKP
jgi:FkbM family methyltransferase